MTVLYPRLLPDEAERRFQRLHGKTPVELEATATTHTSRAIFAATGGARVDRHDLETLQLSVMALASQHGYPAPPGVDARNAFDAASSRLLHKAARMSPGEASQKQVWSFMALVLLPHICAWRFPGKNGVYVPDRFTSGDLTRHTLARTWWRAHILYDAAAADPYHLLTGLTEAAMDQLMARRKSVAASPALARAVVRTFRDSSHSSGADRPIVRDTLKRLLRLTAFVDVDSLDDVQLRQLVDEQVGKALEASARRWR